MKPAGSTRKRLRWIVRKRDDGRYIVRAPKMGAMIRNLSKKRNSDYGKDTLLPKGAVILPSGRRSTRKLRRS